MAYIWNNYSKDKEYKVATSGISPYMEVWNPDDKIVLVNIFYRLCEILLPFSGKDAENKINRLLGLYEEEGRYIDFVNIILHYIAQMDLIKGITVQDLLSFEIYGEIINGYYGQHIKECFGKVRHKDRVVITRYIAKYDTGKQKEIQFDALLKAVFGRVVLYYDKPLDILYIYIDAEKNGYNQNLYNLSEYFLKDIDVKTEVLWKGGHFGIIGIDNTMEIDKLSLI